MNQEGVAVVDRAEQTKWRDALDLLHAERLDGDKFIQMARDCHHPDAQWLASLFPVGTQRPLLDAMQEQWDDPRAMYIAWRVLRASQPGVGYAGLAGAALLGYAPAQAHLSSLSHDGVDVFDWRNERLRKGIDAALRSLHTAIDLRKVRPKIS
jgi:hypothetical protein